MSVQAMAYVFDHETRTGGSERLVFSLWRITRGRRCWVPGSTESGRGGDSSNGDRRESLRRLEAKGLIVRVVNGAPDQRIRRDRRPNLYFLNLVENGGTESGDPSGSDGYPESGSTGTRETRSRVHAKRVDGYPESGDLTVSEPREEPSEDPSRDPLPSVASSETLVVFGPMADDLVLRSSGSAIR